MTDADIKSGVNIAIIYNVKEALSIHLMNRFEEVSSFVEVDIWRGVRNPIIESIRLQVQVPLCRTLRDE